MVDQLVWMWVEKTDVLMGQTLVGAMVACWDEMTVGQ